MFIKWERPQCVQNINYTKLDPDFVCHQDTIFYRTQGNVIQQNIKYLLP